MTKLHESQEKNNLNPHILPFAEVWKSTLLSKAALYGIPLDDEKNNIKSIYDTIKAHEDEQRELSQRTIDIQNNNRYFGDYEKHIIDKAIAYHIPVMDDLDITRLCLEVDDYEWLLDQAGDRLLDWDTSKYDPEGLQKAINDYDYDSSKERLENDWRCYITGIKAFYNNSRGV